MKNISRCCRLLVFAVIQVVLLVGLCHADLTGSWKGSYHVSSTRLGTLDFDLVQRGKKLEGTILDGGEVVTTFNGDVSANVITFSLEHPETCHGIIAGSGVVQGEILTWRVESAECSWLLEAQGAATRKPYATGRWINGIQTKTITGNQVEGGIWCQVSDPAGKQIRMATVVTPRHEEFGLEHDENEGRWATYITSGPASFLNHVFPDGVYGFNLIFEDNSRGAAFVTLTGDYPDEFPLITSPAASAVVDETKELSVTWATPSSSVTSVYWKIMAGANEESDGHLPASATQLSIPPNTYGNKEMAVVSISYNRKVLGVFSNKIKETEHLFFTTKNWSGHPRMVVGKVVSPEGEHSGFLQTELMGRSIKAVALKGGREKEGVSLSKRSENVWGFIMSDSLENITARFPNGIYRMEVTYTDQSKENIELLLAGEIPEKVPLIITPKHGLKMDREKSFGLVWDAFDDQFSGYNRLTMLRMLGVDGPDAPIVSSPAQDLTGKTLGDVFFSSTVDDTILPGSIIPSKGYLRMLLLFVDMSSSSDGSTGKGTGSWIDVTTDGITPNHVKLMMQGPYSLLLE